MNFEAKFFALIFIAVCTTGCGAGTSNEPAVDNSTPPAETSNSRKGITPAASLDEDSWDNTAQEFAAAWADSSGGKDAWLARLKPLTSESVYNELKQTDESVIQHFTYDDMVTVNSDYESLQFIVDLFHKDEDVLRIGIALVDDGSKYSVQYVASM